MDAALVYRSHNLAWEQLQQQLNEDGRQQRQVYQVAQEMLLSSISDLALFIANEPHTQQLLSLANQALEDEGQGTGGPRTAWLRQQLHEQLSPSWQEITQHFMARRMYFYLGSQAINFLRMHNPQHFGDPLNRHPLAMDVKRDLQPRSGLELTYPRAGLQSVVPLYDKSQPPRPIGLLEVGYDLKSLVEILNQQLNTQIAVVMPPQANFPKTTPLMAPCQCQVVATTSEQVVNLVEQLPETLLQSTTTPTAPTHTYILPLANRWVALTHFAIQDYPDENQQQPHLSGQLLIWHNIDTLVSQLHQDTWRNIVLAILGFLLVEALLFLAIYQALRQLSSEIEVQTQAARKLNNELENQVNRDPLTGVHNRRYLMNHLSQAYQQCPLTLIMLDLDHFKRINDSYGHLEGDVVLRQIGQILTQATRNQDIVTRYGGEEFCLVLLNTNGEQALQVAERIRSLVEKQVRVPTAPKHPVTCSIGLCDSSHSSSPYRLLSLADQALYQAKKAGRNQVVLYQADPAQGENTAN